MSLHDIDAKALVATDRFESSINWRVFHFSNDGPVPNQKRMQVLVTIGEISRNIDFKVDNLLSTPIILGMQALALFGLTFGISQEVLTFDPCRNNPLLNQGLPRNKPIRLLDNNQRNSARFFGNIEKQFPGIVEDNQRRPWIVQDKRSGSEIRKNNFRNNEGTFRRSRFNNEM